jgi:hypothetical protein
LARCGGRNGCFEGLSLPGIEQGGGDFVKPLGALLEFSHLALEESDTIGQVEGGQDRNANRIIAGAAGSDLVHQVIDGPGQRLGFARFPGGTQRIRVLEDRDPNEVLFN